MKRPWWAVFALHEGEEPQYLGCARSESEREALDDVWDPRLDSAGASPLVVKLSSSTDIDLELLAMLVKAIGREGWEEGPTEDEVLSRAVDRLANLGCDPYTDDGAPGFERLVLSGRRRQFGDRRG